MWMKIVHILWGFKINETNKKKSAYKYLRNKGPQICKVLKH